MPFTSQQARGRVQPDPTGTGKVGLCPRMQIGKIPISAAGAVETLLIGDELNQISRRKARGDTEVAKDLHQQPGAVATRAHAALQRFFRRLHTGFHADQVFDVVLKPCVERDDEIDGDDRLVENCLACLGDPGCD